MPLMMDDEDQYMNELFGGDGEQLPQVTIPATILPPVKGLPQRLQELTLTNCTNKISWSRFGVLAAIDATGYVVNIHNYVRDANSRTWKLTRPLPIEIKDTTLLSHPIVHVAWSDFGNSLAAVNAAGRVAVFNQGSTVGQMIEMRLNASTLYDETNAMIGLHWLPLWPHQRQSGIYWSVRWDGDKFFYDQSHHLTTGPYNQVEQKSALFCMSRSGTLRLLYEQGNGTWYEASYNIDGPSTTTFDPLLTHAAFAPSTGNDQALLMTVCDTSNRVRVFRIQIRWKPSQKDKQDPKAVSASLDVQTLVDEDSCVPTVPAQVLDQPQDFSLTHLSIIPAAPEGRTHDQTFPTISAVFAVLPNTYSSLDEAQLYQQATSVICRWQIREGMQSSLSPCFDQLKVKKSLASSVNSQTIATLDRLPDVTLHCPIMSTTDLRCSTQLAFIFSDGSVQFRDRESMDLIAVDNNILGVAETQNLPEIKSLAQIGFTFPHIDTSLHTTFSPNHSVIAYCKPDGSVALKNMEYTVTAMSQLTVDDPKFSAVSAALALQHSSALVQYKSADDLLAILPKDVSEKLIVAFVDQCRRATRSNYDVITEEGMKQLQTLVARGGVQFKCLSVQNVLGISSKGIRNLPAKLAWSTLNLRFSFYILGNIFNKPKEPPRAELAASIGGQLRWVLDFLIYLFQELIELSFAIKGKEDNLQFVQEQVSSLNSPALAVLMASLSRELLRYICRPIRIGFHHAQTAVKSQSTTPADRIVFTKMVTVCRQAPINISAFEIFLADIDMTIKQVYTAAGFDDRQRTDAENEMMLCATIPEVLGPAVATIMTEKFGKLIEVSEPGNAHNHEVAWLGLTDDRKSRSLLAKTSFDVVRKLPLVGNPPTRTCTRCRSVVEDLVPPGMGGQGQQGQPVQQVWVYQGMKQCVCFSSWVKV